MHIKLILMGAGVAVPGTVQLMVPLLHPVVHSDSLAKHIPHGDREIAVDLTTRSRCCR